MKRSTVALVSSVLIGTLVVNGCTTLLKDPVKESPQIAKHCSGSEWYSTNSLAVIPIPVVAFFVPHVTIGGVDTNEVLNRCGSTLLVNRSVERNLGACIPVGFLTFMITLGIVAHCPSKVTYEADVVGDKTGSLDIAPRMHPG